ncbi:hypothetical protein [Aestuariicoccus sp. MJ-SS9]|uniref:hypothetical protein n=1 Tax=Aestuariicoccus sp. MJ-SS9 TaxID=3079855 RepID=UPI00290AB278|nr:hypothetical protein [Aestuariicoccus sp. MJ-SS9]MDU8911392.1 hypothetical protein [Aestuariicoccus sp. MJ-SS9]
MKRYLLPAALILMPVVVGAQSGTHGADHSHMDHGSHGVTPAPAPAPLSEGGQAAFAAIQEVVAALMADSGTDWTQVDIEALRQHLIDMDNVTLRAKVRAEDIEGGARFEVTSDVPGVMASIRRMIPAHAATVDGVEGWRMTAGDIDGGAALTVQGGDPARIRGLGFIGIMTVGMHHQTHHLALARGGNPHAH